MDQETTSTLAAGGWLWGGIWVFYAYMYGRYFGHVARRVRAEDHDPEAPGSPERLYAKQQWSYRFAIFMTIPAALESIRSSLFTTALITALPCLFGIWVMHAVWREVLRSKIPASSSARRP